MCLCDPSSFFTPRINIRMNIKSKTKSLFWEFFISILKENFKRLQSHDVSLC